MKLRIIFLAVLALPLIYFVISNPGSKPKQTPSPKEIKPPAQAIRPSKLNDGCGNAVGNGETIIDGPSKPEGSDYDQVFRSLIVDPRNARTVILGTERNGFLKSRDGGMTWERLRRGLRHEQNRYPEVWNLAIAPSSPATLLAATLDSPGPITEMGGIYKSTDGGGQWQRSNCGLENSRITSVIFDSTDANQAVVGVEGGASTRTESLGQYFPGGLYFTVDGGASWQKAEVPGNFEKNGYWNLYYRQGTFYTFGFNYENLKENVGFIKSNDGGQRWRALGSELKNLLITSFDVSFDGQTLYANARDSFQIKKSIDGGDTWSNFKNGANGPLAVSPIEADLLLFAAHTSLYRSADGLKTSTKVLDSPNQFDDIVFAPSDPNVVYAATKGYLLYKSNDAGLTWTLVKNLRSEVLAKIK